MTTVLPPQSTEKPLEVSVAHREKGRFSTTPGRLRLLSILSVGAILILLIVSAGALSSRRGAAKSAGNDSGALLVQVQELYRVLSDADASASTSLLKSGGVSTAIHDQYVTDIKKAGQLLSDIADHSLSSNDARRAVAVIAQELPRYSEQVESARVQTRLGFPVGAQHMRDGSELMRGTILPATLDLYTSAAHDLNDDYRRGTSASQMTWIVVIGLGTLAVLVAVQIYAAGRTNRVLNVGLLAASVIVAVLLLWTLLRFNAEQNSLVRAQRNGSDSVQVLSIARILGLQAHASSNLAVAEHGTGDAYRAEFARVMQQLCGGKECRGGLLAYAATVADRTGTADRVTSIQEDAAAFWAQADQVTKLDDGGNYGAAVALALGDQADAARALDDSVAAESESAQVRFNDAAGDAQRGFGVLAIALTLGLLLAAVLVLIGLQPRIEEYR